MSFKVVPYGESAFLIQFADEISVETHLQVKACYQQLKKMHIHGVQSLIPAYNSITVMFDQQEIEPKTLKVFLENTPYKLAEEELTKNIVEIPVCYEAPYALDMEYVSGELNLSTKEIIDIHTADPYLVYMIGFAPGFMYLGGLDKRLHTPRKQTPRLQIPAGAVGLADQQTGVYPMITPGGWQIIGQTPISLFSKEKPSLVAMGDYVQFVSISVAEFEKLKNT
ncbi:5-oxoprolinase subunit PxpB [Wenyingzhuangia sp. chi5]|uniref:5-oxoprolinase subunit PxpB n=1 Tax=Wenyingzhuangia gilva TaxID=3057677 RepID=A0ABT8VSF2_9FLAO|nr:5-oxoprolinase subunit PxpB [Wenyingzhuangia sp. chi5]MDO3694887.1 5-oxoprolinase subunit PxpB [Wenyingzhuangia sp. chi5]